jgi:hypothetical protein
MTLGFPAGFLRVELQNEGGWVFPYVATLEVGPGDALPVDVTLGPDDLAIETKPGLFGEGDGGLNFLFLVPEAPSPEGVSHLLHGIWLFAPESSTLRVYQSLEAWRLIGGYCFKCPWPAPDCDPVLRKKLLPGRYVLRTLKGKHAFHREFTLDRPIADGRIRWVVTRLQRAVRIRGRLGDAADRVWYVVAYPAGADPLPISHYGVGDWQRWRPKPDGRFEVRAWPGKLKLVFYLGGEKEQLHTLPVEIEGTEDVDLGLVEIP